MTSLTVMVLKSMGSYPGSAPFSSRSVSRLQSCGLNTRLTLSSDSSSATSDSLYIDTRSKMSPSKKWTLRQAFIRVIDWRYSQPCWYFDPSLWFNSTVCKGGYGVLGLRQINTCRKVLLQVNFFR